MEYILFGIICALTAVLTIKIYLLQKGLKEIDNSLEEILDHDTNRQITLSSRDRSIRRLASRLNVHLGKLRKSQLKYVNGDRELKESITNISHDLRTPLTAISGYLELLEKEIYSGESQNCPEKKNYPGSDNCPRRIQSCPEEKPYLTENRPYLGKGACSAEGTYCPQGKTCSAENQSCPEKEAHSTEVLRCLAVIRNRTEHMKQLTEELFRCSLALSVPEEKPQLLSLNKVLEESLLSFYEALLKKGITPTVHMPETPVMRILDPAALSRVFQNILGNAVKYSGGDLNVCLTEDGTVTCSNTAPNLNPLLTEQLFDRYYTVETVSSPNAGGSTGLGLSIARLLTERMGGEISAVCIQPPSDTPDTMVSQSPTPQTNRLEIKIRFPAHHHIVNYNKTSSKCNFPKPS